MEGRDLIVSGKSFHSLGPLYMTDQRQSCELIAGMGKSLFFLKRRPVFLILFVGKLITQEGRQELTALKTNNSYVTLRWLFIVNQFSLFRNGVA